MLNFTEILFIIIALGLSIMIHHLVIDLTHRKGIFMDSFEKVQKAHILPTPRIGGLGIFLASMLMALNTPLGSYIMIASIPAFLAGFLEDYSNRVAPTQRLAIMLLAPIIATMIIPESVINHFAGLEITRYIGIPITILFTTALVNGVNFIDGQNGLAGSSVTITFLSITVAAILLQDKDLIYITTIAAVSIIGFLRYNYPKGRIFLGDGGAYFLGFIASIICIIFAQRHFNEIHSLFIIALLIYPLWEVFFSTLRKLLIDNISPFRSDKYHLHQLIFRNQANRNEYLPTVIILPFQILTSVLSVIFMNNGLALLLIIIGYVTFYTSFYYINRKQDILRRANLINKKNALHNSNTK